MEGIIAHWYARVTAGDRPVFEAEARALAWGLAPGARVLEIAPGPGYLAIALAKLGDFEITGLDLSRTFVRIAAERARRAGAAVRFVHGDASAAPLPGSAFDLILCRAAFKNFADPAGALSEMWRLLAPGGEALIQDMRRDATDEAIEEHVRRMGVGPITAAMTRFIFRHDLRPRAWRREDLERLVVQSPFGEAAIAADPLGLEMSLRKPQAPRAWAA